jgi:hypothetical protein
MLEYVFNGPITASKEEWLSVFEEVRRPATTANLNSTASTLMVPSKQH